MSENAREKLDRIYTEQERDIADAQDETVLLTLCWQPLTLGRPQELSAQDIADFTGEAREMVVRRLMRLREVGLATRVPETADRGLWFATPAACRAVELLFGAREAIR